MSWSSVSYFLVLILSMIIGDLLCGDLTNNGQTLRNPWQLQSNRSITASAVQFDSNKRSSTPWLILGQKRQNNALSNSNQQPMWIQPNNGNIWVRNTPSPPTATQISNKHNIYTNIPNSDTRIHHKNTNTDFINIEKGANQNTGSNVSKPNAHSNPVGLNQNRGITNNFPNGMNAMNNKFPISTNNNGMPSILPSGSLTGNREETMQSNSNSRQSNGNIDDNELRDFSEEIYRKDVNNAAKYLQINLQGTTTSRSMRDEAPLSLLSVNQAAFAIPSVSKVMLLYNNYILETNQNEVYTAQEKLEENDLLDTILSTPVMEHTRNFLIKNGRLGKDPKEFRDLLKEIWFNMYSRGKGRIGSSGFEHVFLAELKGNQVSGLHNWIYFNEEELKHNANYLGYMKKLDLGNKGMILKYHFTFHNIDKPVGSMFIGTSPELEMALYSTCFILRADRICPLKMNGNKFIIRTYTSRYRGKNMIGSAFPEI